MIRSKLTGVVLLMAGVLTACVATNKVGITRPEVPPATADNWTIRYNDGAGNPTLATAEIAWVEAVVGSKAGMNLVADCRGRDTGDGLNVSLERDRLPRDAYLGEAINLTANVRGRTKSIRNVSIGTVPFDGFGVDQSGGYRFKATERMISAMQRGSTITFSGPNVDSIRFSLIGANKALKELGCV